MDREVCSIVLQRWKVIESLRVEPKDKRTMVDDLDCSRSTVNRAIRELESMGVVGYEDGRYEVTPLGKSIADGFDEILTTVDLQLELEPFLRWMPDDEFDLDLIHLKDAKLVLPESGDPYRVINHHIKRLRTLEKGSFLVPYTGLHATETACERIVHHEATGELVVKPDVVKTFKNDPDYADVIKKIAATGNFSIFQVTAEMPFSLAIFTNRVQIIADEDEEPRALVESDSDEVRNWAKNTFEEYKKRAEPVEITATSKKARL